MITLSLLGKFTVPSTIPLFESNHPWVGFPAFALVDRTAARGLAR